MGHVVVDAVLCICFALFAVTSLVYEPYVTFGVDLCARDEFVARSWCWYAESFDPLFLETPTWLMIMCTIDFVVFGPIHLLCLYAFFRQREWIRSIALVYGGALFYSTLVYFGYEFMEEMHRADMLWVVLINVPYTLMPMLLLYRTWGSDSLWPKHKQP